MKYTTFANTVQAILESRSLTHIINTKVEEPLEVDKPIETDDTAPVAGEGIDGTERNDMLRMARHIKKRSMRRQHKMKIIDNT